MQWWRKLLALLGLSKDARVNIRAKGIDITVIGEPELVRAMLAVVKGELESIHRQRRLQKRSVSTFRIETGGEHTLNSDSQVVQPTDLDELDSPYAIPEHNTIAPEAATPTDAPVTDRTDNPPAEYDIRDTMPADGIVPGVDDLDGEPEREVTAIVADPSGPRAPISMPIVDSPTQSNLDVDVPPTRRESRAIPEDHDS